MRILNKKNISIFFCFIFFISILSSSSYNASYIQIQTSIESDIINNNSTKIKVNLNQTGDEAAYNIEIEPIVSDEFNANKTIRKDILNPGESLNEIINLSKNKPIYTGEYPFAVLIKYQDANGYPFSTVSYHSIKYKEETTSDIFGEIEEYSLNEDETGSISINVRNYDVKNHNIKITLYLPREIKSEKKQKILPVEGFEEKIVNFEVESFGALKGSKYPIFASLEYEDERYHYNYFAKGTIEIIDKKDGGKSIFSNRLFLLVPILVLLILIYAYYKYKDGSKN